MSTGQTFVDHGLSSLKPAQSASLDSYGSAGVNRGIPRMGCVYKKTSRSKREDDVAFYPKGLK